MHSKFLLPGSIFATIFLINSIAYGTPEITNVSQGSDSADNITITGDGFTGNDNKVLLYDLVNNLTQYQSVQSGEPVTSNNSAWGAASETNWGRTPPKFVKSGDLRYPNAKIAYEGAVSFLEKPKKLDGTNLRKIYVSWYFKPDYLVGESEANKYIRIWDRLDGLGTRISWTSMHLTYEAREINYSPPASWSSTRPSNGKWNHFEVYVDSDKNIIEASLNGETKHSVTDFRKSSNSNGFTIGLIGFDPVHNDEYTSTSFRLSDVYVSNSRARVEISDSAQWNPQANREILYYDSWSNGKINAQLNDAAKRFDKMYLYVIDNNGDVNKNGYVVSECKQCPNPPSSINIE